MTMVGPVVVSTCIDAATQRSSVQINAAHDFVNIILLIYMYFLITFDKDFNKD